MTELWHEAELKRPPLVTVDVADAQFVERIYEALNIHMNSNREDIEEFGKTAAMLSRLIARRKNSFHRLIGFRILLKLNSMTCRLLRADLPRDIEMFWGSLPDIVLAENSIASLPTKNCLDYVLVRLLSVYHIQRRIHDCTVDAADCFLQFIRNNSFLDISTLLYAVLAKLRSLNAGIGNRYIDLYAKLLKYRHRFPMTKSKNFIPDGTELLKNLEPFVLPEPLQEGDEEIEKNSDKSKTTKVSLLQPAIITANAPVIKRRVDMGTKIERKLDKDKKVNKQILEVDKLKSIEDIQKFIESENQARRKQTTKICLTHRIPDHMWMGAQKIFEKRLQAGENRKAMAIFLNYLKTHL